MLKRNIVTNIKFSIGKINITVLEKLPKNMVAIFNRSSSTKSAYSFLSNSLKEIAKIVGGEINEISVIFEPTHDMKYNISIHQESLNIVDDLITQNDIKNVIKLTKNHFENSNEKVILVQPISFSTFNEVTKSYDRAPLDKQASKLTITSAVTTIDIKIYKYIKSIIDPHNLEISQILLSQQAVTQNNLSQQALFNGSILIHIDDQQSFITINNRLATSDVMIMYEHGYKHFINGISKIFGCSRERADELVSVHNTLETEIQNNATIYSQINSLEEKKYDVCQLRDITKTFFDTLFMVAKKFIDQKQLEHLPIVISGNLKDTKNLIEVARQYFGEYHVSIYNPISFVETNDKNIETLGMIKFMERMDEKLGKQYNTIVVTNPNLVSTLKKNKKSQSWIAKFTDKIGGKYEWN